MGPLLETSKGYSYILTIQDHLTKFSFAIPLKSITAIQVADALLKFFICILEPTKIILTDQGTNFMSTLMNRFAKQFKIKQYRTSAFYPQANGALERVEINIRADVPKGNVHECMYVCTCAVRKKG